MSDAATASADAPGHLSFESTATLDDHVALQMRWLAKPSMRSNRLWLVLLWMLIFVGSVLMTLMFDAKDPRPFSGGRLPLASILDYLPIGGSNVLLSLSAVLGMSACIVFLNRRLVRSHVRRIMRRMLLARPDVDPSDPRLAYRSHVIASHDGIEGRSGTGALFLRWQALQLWEEKDGRLFVLGDSVAGFCLNTSTIDPTALDRFRTILKERLGSKALA